MSQRPVEYYEFSSMAKHIECLGLSRIAKGSMSVVSMGGTLWEKHYA